MFLIHFSLKVNQFLSNGSEILPKDLPIVLVYANEFFMILLLAKALQSPQACVLVNNNLGGNLISLLESQTTIEKSFIVTSVPFSIPVFLNRYVAT